MACNRPDLILIKASSTGGLYLCRRIVGRSNDAQSRVAPRDHRGRRRRVEPWPGHVRPASRAAAQAGRHREARDPAARSLRAEPGRAQGGADRTTRREAGRADPDRGRVCRSQSDLFPALRRLPWRAEERRHRQAAHPGPDARAWLRLPAGVHHLRLAGRHAQLGHLGRSHRGAGRPHGALPLERSGDAARVRHGRGARHLDRARPGRAAPDPADERPRHRQSVLGDAARRRAGRADRRRQLRDRQRPRHRLRRAHFPHLGVRPLSLRDRTRRQGRSDRSLDGPAAGGRDGQDRPRGTLGRDLQVPRAGKIGTPSPAPTGRRNSSSWTAPRSSRSRSSRPAA